MTPEEMYFAGTVRRTAVRAAAYQALQRAIKFAAHTGMAGTCEYQGQPVWIPYNWHGEFCAGGLIIRRRPTGRHYGYVTKVGIVR